MKKLLIGFLAFGAFSVQASMLEVNGPLDSKFFEAEVLQDKSYFETLGDLFSQGTVPDLKKISNIAWAGRCFLKDEPNNPTNAGYIFREKKSDVGPIGRNSKSYEVLSYWLPKKAPDFFDKLTLDQVLNLPEAKITKFVDANINSSSINIGLSSLKSSGSYLVEEVGMSSSPAIRCYYFIPDLNN
jgi:hypothetical protein